MEVAYQLNVSRQCHVRSEYADSLCVARGGEFHPLDLPCSQSRIYIREVHRCYPDGCVRWSHQSLRLTRLKLKVLLKILYTTLARREDTR